MDSAQKLAFEDIKKTQEMMKQQWEEMRELETNTLKLLTFAEKFASESEEERKKAEEEIKEMLGIEEVNQDIVIEKLAEEYIKRSRERALRILKSLMINSYHE